MVDDAADAALFDTYQAERRPAAQVVADSGDDFEHAQLVVGSAALAARHDALRSTFPIEATRHHEAVAHAELNIDYSGSPIVAGDADEQLGPGDRMPTRSWSCRSVTARTVCTPTRTGVATPSHSSRVPRPPTMPSVP